MNIVHRKAAASSGGVSLGPYRIESLLSEAEEGRFTAYRVRVEPGQTTSESYHKVAEELYYVIEGRGTAVLDGVEHDLAVGDFLRLPPGTRHRFVTGDQPLVMLDVHSPGSRPNRDVFFTGETPDGFSGDSG